MSQNAVVKRNITSGLVEISLMRELECGNGCKNCDICTARPTDEILSTATDPIGVSVGDWVEVELTSTSAITAALLIYLLPCLTLLGGYLLGEWIGLSVVSCLLLAAIGLVVGFAPARIINRNIQKKNEPEFTITKRK